MAVIPKMHEPSDATRSSPRRFLASRPASSPGRDRHADAIGVSRKLRLGFRRTLRGELASLAGGMLRRGLGDRASRVCQNLARTLQIVLSVD